MTKSGATSEAQPLIRMSVYCCRIVCGRMAHQSLSPLDERKYYEAR
jgi:hypothetical protein